MGPGLESLGDWENMFENDLINDVYDMNEKEKLAAGRAFERADIYHDTKEGYVLFGCVCPSYGWPAPLLPAIMVSKTGEKGTWKYLGKLKGEPALEYAKGKTWSDGGSIVRSTDGKWRAYLNGFGTVLAAIECDTLDGEWRFLRNANGEIREILPDFPKDKGHGGCFPQVLKIDEKDWHCWISDKWPPQSIFHFQSDDGLNWKPFGKQPEITRKAFNGMPIKCLRCFYDSKSKKIIGLLSIWGKLPQAELKSTRNNTDQWWCLYMSTMPPVPACP